MAIFYINVIKFYDNKNKPSIFFLISFLFKKHIHTIFFIFLHDKNLMLIEMFINN